jgi:DNA-binding transcriptional LysR family regulator
MIDLRSLRYAVTLERYQHFGRAAEALHISQSALSQRIGAMEQSLGVALFERDSSGVRPTKYGELLVERGGKLLADASELQRELALMQGIDVDELRLAVGGYPADLLVGEALGRLSKSRPGLKINVTTGNFFKVAEAVREERVEVGVAGLSVATENPVLATLLLRPLHFVIACRPGHPLAGRNDLQLSDILRYPLVGPPIPARIAARLPVAFAAGYRDQASGDFQPNIATDLPSLALQIAADSDALFPAPAEWLATCRQSVAIEILDFAEPWMTANHGIIWLRDRPLSPAAAAFMDLMRSIAGIEADSTSS